MQSDLSPILLRVPSLFSLHVCTIKFAPVCLYRRVCWGWRQCRQMGNWRAGFLGTHACRHVILWGVHVCFFSGIGVQDCLCICGLTITTPHADANSILFSSTPSTVSALRPQRAVGGGVPLLLRHIPRSPTNDMTVTPKIGARRRRIILSSCSPLPAPCSDKASHLASHPHKSLACNNT